MDRKRCVYCNRLSPANAEICERCGHTFGEAKSRQTKKIPLRRSIPPASPHKAGHYSGLHPEDQPYQTNTLALQPLPHPGQRGSLDQLAEQEMVILTDDDDPSLADFDAHYQIAPPGDLEDQFALLPDIEENPSLQPSQEDILSYAPGRSPGIRVVPVIITVACLLVLIAGSLLAYLSINKNVGPTLVAAKLTARPNLLRVNDTFILAGSGFLANDLINFTRDGNITLKDGNGQQLSARANDAGSFSVQITVPATWDIGLHSILALDEGQHVSATTSITVEQAPPSPPHLRLSDAAINLGAELPGVISSKNITLTNTGGGQVTWQASSDQPWLTISPTSGTFSGSAFVTVTVNRGVQPADTYTGNIMFVQQGAADQPLTLAVTMVVDPAPASLSVLNGSLTYSASSTQNPPDQTITLQNNGSEALDWSSSAVTGDGHTWLSISPASGRLDANRSTTVTVHVQSLNLAVGSYQGMISFRGGANPQVAVTLTVIAPGNLLASPPSQNVTMSQGQNPPDQKFTLQNSGGQAVDWTVSVTTSDGTSWLSATPVSGHLEAGAQTPITISVNALKLIPGSYQGMLTFSYGTLTKQVAVSLTVSPPPAAISLSTSTMSFSSILGTNPAAQTFTITNSGGSVLNWVLNEDQSAQLYITVTPRSGSLEPGNTATITVTPSVAQILGAGVLSATLTVVDSDIGTSVVSQAVAVTMTLKDQAVITLSANTMGFTNTFIVTDNSQTLTINNTGSSPLNWATKSSASWLYADVTSGTIQPGKNIVVRVHCNSASLNVGTYKATLTIIDSDAGTLVTSQTINVTLTVAIF